MFKIFLTTLVLTVFTFADAQVLKTGQTISYDTDGNVVTDGSVKDDGYYQTGASRSYTRSSVGVVIDNVTKLEWQDDYSDNAGSIKSASWQGALDYCAALELDGEGWRSPSIEELESIVDEGNFRPSVTAGVFTEISTFVVYWSSTTYALDTVYDAWVVYFDGGNRSHIIKYTSNNLVRCVRGGQLEPSNFSRDDATEIVTDSTTGLQWQDNEIVETTTRTWQEAIDYCENNMTLGGHNDWRLPNIKELLSIADRSRISPAIDTSVFENISSNSCWSSTTYSGLTSNAWYVSSYNGTPNGYDKAHSYYVRCVRGGQLDTSSSLSPVIMYLLD